jgi:hypothetical protein
MKSALLAASSIRRAGETGESADAIYLEGLDDIVSVFRDIYPWFRRIIGEAKNGGYSMPQVLRDGYLAALRPF